MYIFWREVQRKPVGANDKKGKITGSGLAKELLRIFRQ
jgi:hypothetical protein